jgi:CRP-like cAMP-binding protein
MSNHPALLPFLQTLPIFAGLEERTLGLLARVSHTKKVCKGEILFFQGDPGDAAYIVRHGTIGIVLTTPDGRELFINEMRTGELFGELALLQDEPRSARAVAWEDSEVVWIPRREFLALVDAQPSLMRQLLETIADRLRNSGERERALAFLDAPARLARVLIQKVKEEGEADDLVMISQEELAQFVGVTRQTVTRILGDWRRDGWIITGRGRIMLVDQAALRKLADEGERM